MSLDDLGFSSFAFMEGLARFETHFAHDMNSHLYEGIQWEKDTDAASPQRHYARGHAVGVYRCLDQIINGFLMDLALLSAATIACHFHLYARCFLPILTLTLCLLSDEKDFSWRSKSQKTPKPDSERKWGFIKKKRPFNHLFLADRILRAWYVYIYI